MVNLVRRHVRYPTGIYHPKAEEAVTMYNDGVKVTKIVKKLRIGTKGLYIILREAEEHGIRIRWRQAS
jgi:DNA invertase Pin-like site-specific DNA recombinase